MLKSILKLDGAQQLSKENQKSIIGGECTTTYNSNGQATYSSECMPDLHTL